MNEELWASVERKMRGYIDAVKQVGVSCDTCGEYLQPHDTGVDTLTGKRNWVVKCCGKTLSYEEKVDLGYQGLVDDEL
jgi:ribosomal protein L32